MGTPSYSNLEDREAESLMAGCETPSLAERTRNSTDGRWHKTLNYVLAGLDLFLGAALVLRAAPGERKASAEKCGPECCHYYSPALEASWTGARVSHVEDIRRSPYIHGDAEHMDANWTALLRVGMMGITDEELRRVGATPRSIRLPPESGGGYMAYLASHHHLHCLYILYQSLHSDYYSTRSVVWHMPEFLRLGHMDHCVDELRQYVMCNADATVVTHEWVDGLRAPIANQANPRVRADWDSHFQWQLDRQVPAPSERLTNPSMARDD